MVESGSLFIVPTPIGNLQDVTLRALEVLSQVNIIAAEDTRHSQKLLQHYDIQTRMISLHDHNEAQRAKQIIEKLKLGESIALISDAGTPLISDPGYSLVNQCREADIKVIPLPGACAAITALCAAGLPTDRFIFEGFLPVKQQAKLNVLEKLSRQSGTCVFYESPRRIEDTLKATIQALGEDRKVVIAKELTKAFETFYSGTAIQALAWLQEDSNHQRGEFVFMVDGYKALGDEIPEDAVRLLKALIEDMPLKKAAAITAKHYDLKKNALYQLGLSFDEDK